jgi:DNA-binding NtrC family response regulator
MSNRLIRVLHLDDVEEEFILIRELLSSTEGIDFEFQWVSDVASALAAIQTRKFDVCLVDYYLGRDNGLDFMRAALEQGVGTPFILMSGQKDFTVSKQAMQLGARQCLDKNEITDTLLLKAIKAAVGNS